MRFRIKIKGLANTLTVALESESATVANLKENIKNQFMLNDEETRNLNLSFNGKTIIETKDNDTLKSLGFVSGDIIHIIGLHSVPALAETIEPTCIQAKVTNNSESQKEPILSNINKKKMSKLNETKNPDKIVDIFSDLISHNESHFQTDFNKFCGLLHILMIETGFIPKCSNPLSSPYQLPDPWEVKSGTITLQYASSYQPYPGCKLAIISIGSTAVISGLTENTSDRFELNLRISDFLNQQPTNLNELSFLFKNRLAIPLHMALHPENKGNFPAYMIDAMSGSVENKITHINGTQEESMVTTTNKKLPRIDEMEDSEPIPEALSFLLANYGGIFHTDFDKFCGLLHILMIESGFIPQCSKPSSSPYSLPDSWDVNSGTLTLSYTSSYQPYPSCRLAVVSVGLTVVVRGLAEPVPKDLEMTLKMANFIKGKFLNMKELSTTFKNRIAIPLLMTIQHEAKGDMPLNICKLPVEILFRIFRKLPVMDFVRLSKTSTFFLNFASDKNLWKFFVGRDFGPSVSHGLQNETSWKEVYKSHHSRRIQPQRNIPNLFFPERFPVILPRTPFPGMVGGDEDLYPNLMGLEPPSRRRNPQINPFLPRRGGGSFGPYFGF